MALDAIIRTNFFFLCFCQYCSAIRGVGTIDQRKVYSCCVFILRVMMIQPAGFPSPVSLDVYTYKTTNTKSSRIASSVSN